MKKSTMMEVTVVKLEERGDEMKAEKRQYGIDDLFKSLELKEFDAVVFAPREEETTVNGKRQGITVGANLKEKVRAALPLTEPDFVKGLIEEAAARYHAFSHNSERGYEKRVVVGYLTSIGAEELSKSSQTGYFEVPSGLDFVGIAAEGKLDEKVTLAARERLAALDMKDDEFTVYRDVRIKSGKFGSLCGSDSSHLLLEGKDAGYGVFENALDGTGFFTGNVGEYAGKGSEKTHIYVGGDAGSGFMSDSRNGRGSVDGRIKGSSAGAGSGHLGLYVKGDGGDMLLDSAIKPFGAVGGAGNYALYNAHEPLMMINGKAGKLLGEGMTDGYVIVRELDTYQEQGKLLGNGTGKIRVPDQKSHDLLSKENKKGYALEVDENFFADEKEGEGCQSCSACTCGKK